MTKKCTCIYAEKVNTGRPHRYCKKKNMPIYDIEGVCGSCKDRSESEEDV